MTLNKSGKSVLKLSIFNSLVPTTLVLAVFANAALLEYFLSTPFILKLIIVLFVIGLYSTISNIVLYDHICGFPAPAEDLRRKTILNVAGNMNTGGEDKFIFIWHKGMGPKMYHWPFKELPVSGNIIVILNDASELLHEDFEKGVKAFVWPTKDALPQSAKFERKETHSPARS